MKRTHFTSLFAAAAALALALPAFAQTDVADLATLRAQPTGATVYRVTGTVVVTVKTRGLNAGRNQLHVQDSSGTDGQTAILIDDNAFNLAVDYQIGDQLQNLTGTLSVFQNMLQFAPTTTATKIGTTTPPAPLVVTGAITDFETIEGELIRINGAVIPQTGNWAANFMYYTLTPAIGPMNIIWVDDNSELVSTPIPTTAFDMIGLAIQYGANYEIGPRITSDLILPAPTDDPNAELSTGALDFGYLNVSSTRDLPVTITNTSTSVNNLVIASPGFTVSGSNAAQFTVAGAYSFPITLTPGEATSITLRYTSTAALGSADSATATLTSNDANNPSLPLAGATADQVVADLAALRAVGATPNRILVAGTCVVTAGTNELNIGRNQLYLQDASGTDGQTGLYIDDLSKKLGRDYTIGDQVQNLCGSLSIFNEMLQLTPAGVADFVGTTAPPAPLVITPAITDFETIEAELIRVNNVIVDTVDPNFLLATYTIALPTDVLINRVMIEDNSELFGDSIPFKADYIGVAYQTSLTSLRLLPRLDADLIIPPPPLAANAGWSLYE